MPLARPRPLTLAGPPRTVLENGCAPRLPPARPPDRLVPAADSPAARAGSQAPAGASFQPFSNRARYC
ncbi:hypothetical protein [Kitasatospora sp. NPDC096140]|uniref:hypothetical protein n=1 Tax=unclassified Kitasatospora TaxID=2633591 RepID=UPI0033185BB7